MIDISVEEEKPGKGGDPINEQSPDSNRSLDMSVSPVCKGKQGEAYAFVTFTEGDRVAEGKIPACEIIRNQGFSREELEQLREYMKENLGTIKRMAASVHVMDAFLKK